MKCARCHRNGIADGTVICPKCSLEYEECINCQGKRVTDYDNNIDKQVYGCKKCLKIIAGKNWRKDV